MSQTRLEIAKSKLDAAHIEYIRTRNIHSKLLEIFKQLNDDNSAPNEKREEAAAVLELYEDTAVSAAIDYGNALQELEDVEAEIANGSS
jgi:uncharacterized protein (UPF0147 family)